MGMVIFLYVAWRLPWFGHLLSWDEAMNLLTTQTPPSGQTHPFASWRLRYPPFHDGVLRMLEPDRGGYIARAQALSHLFSFATLLVVHFFNRRLFGVLAACGASLALALMPAHTFFSGWIKQDVPLAFAGYLALFCFVEQRFWAAGLFIAMAFLTKHMAGYYAGAMAVVWVLGGWWKIRWDAPLILAGTCLAFAGWYYLGKPDLVAWFMSFAVGGMNSLDWQKPADYYLRQFVVDLGWIGVAFLFAGLVALGLRVQTMWRSLGAAAAAPLLWPVALLIPAYAAMQFSTGKTAWYSIALYPALAALMGLGAGEIIRRVAQSHRFSQRWCGTLGGATTVILVGLLFANAWTNLHGVAYMDFFRRKDAPFAWGMETSRTAAGLMNAVLKPESRYVVSDTWYWIDGPGQICAVFAIYAQRWPELTVESSIAPEGFARLCREEKIDVAWISLETVEERRAFVSGMHRFALPPPLTIPAGLIYPVWPLHKRAGDFEEAP